MFPVASGGSSPLFQRRRNSPRSEPLVTVPLGGYLFLPGTPFLSVLVLAAEGFEIVRAVFRRPPAFAEGFAAVERHLRAAGRPLDALCGLELRSERQTTFSEFAAFNGPYVERLRRKGLLVDDRVPITRTNVAVPGVGATHQICAFSYTVPSSRQAPTFVFAAVPEVRNLGGNPPDVVAGDDTSIVGLRQKTAFILDVLGRNLENIGVGWNDVTAIQLYTVHDVHSLVASLILPKTGDAGKRGIHWQLAQPPVTGVEIEIDLRSTGAELTID